VNHHQTSSPISLSYLLIVKENGSFRNVDSLNQTAEFPNLEIFELRNESDTGGLGIVAPATWQYLQLSSNNCLPTEISAGGYTRVEPVSLRLSVMGAPFK
jgi:hypothetical protein